MVPATSTIFFKREMKKMISLYLNIYMLSTRKFINKEAPNPATRGGNVTRAEQIIVEFTNPGGQLRVIEASGFEAVAIQHEIDHLDGLLFLDRVSSLKTDLYRRKSK